MQVSESTGCHTERGRRPANQDAVLAVRLGDGRELVAVADGMGGHSAGEVASRRALEALWEHLRAGADLQSAVLGANSAVHAAAESNPAWAGMGTTLLAMLRSGQQYEIANVGDSRAYRVSAGSVTQITTDHSLAAESILDARVGSRDVSRSRWRNALTRALGTEPSVDVDVFGPFDAREPHAVLLCSDGVYRTLDDENLLEVVASTRDPWTVARRLTELAYERGSTDNLSAALVVFDGMPNVRRPAVLAPVQVQRRVRRKSRRVRQLDVQLAITGVLLAAIIVALLRLL